jgi:hypothetical protein
MLLRVPDEETRKWFEPIAEDLYRKKVAPSGSIDIQRIPSRESKRRIAGYITKRAYRAASIEHYVLSSEFLKG